MGVRIFSRPWSAERTERARTFYFVVGRFFIALGVGVRRKGHEL